VRGVLRPGGTDLRLALPVLVAWIALGPALAAPDLAVPLTIGAAALCATLLALASRLPSTTRLTAHRPTAAHAGEERLTAGRAGAERRVETTPSAPSPAPTPTPVPSATSITTRIRSLLPVVAAAAGLSAVLLGSLAVHDPARRPSELQQRVGERAVVRVVLDEPAPAPGRRPVVATAIDVRASDAGRPGDPRPPEPPLSAPIAVFGALPDAPAGAMLDVAGGLEAGDPGSDDAYLLFADDAELLGVPDGDDPLAELRAGLREASAGLGSVGAQLLPGLAVGDTTGVGAELDAAMRAASLTHLTAVSGANCAVVVGLVVALASALGLSRRVRIGAALTALVGFVALVTPQPSVLRAAVMAAVVLLALGTGRPGRGVPVLALAVLALLVADPWLARDYGFVLSVAATAALLLLAPPLAARLAQVMPPWLALTVAIPVAAQLACQPVLILLEPALPTGGVVANLLAEPAAPLATVLGLVACLVLPVVPALGGLLLRIAWLPAEWIGQVALTTAAAPAARLPWPGEWPGAALLAVLTAIGLVAVLGRGRMRRVAAAALVASVVAGAAAAGGARLLTGLARPADWQYAACDVGQGDAMLIRSGDEVALVDTGPDPELVRSCLDDLGVARLDLLVLTHFDLDHVGGAPALEGRVDRVFTGPTDGADAERLLDSLAASGAVVDEVRTGAAGRLGELVWRVLWPPPRGAPEPGNAASVALLVEPAPGCAARCLSGLFLGDLGEEEQRRMAAADPVGRVDVVKVSHHGSADQDAGLYTAVAATVGLVGVGAGNDYGHPTAALLELLASAGTEPLRTDRDGLVLVAGASGRVRVWTERAP